MAYSDEEQQEIEAEFIKSWDQVEIYFKAVVYPAGRTHLKSLLTLVHQLREQGYDRRLRAGYALTGFILTRARKHGLTQDQPSLVFSVRREGEILVEFLAINTRVRFAIDRPEITPEIENLLIPLLVYPID